MEMWNVDVAIPFEGVECASSLDAKYTDWVGPSDKESSFGKGKARSLFR